MVRVRCMSGASMMQTSRREKEPILTISASAKRKTGAGGGGKGKVFSFFLFVLLLFLPLFGSSVHTYCLTVHLYS
jgi:hypothetical protein